MAFSVKNTKGLAISPTLRKIGELMASNKPGITLPKIKSNVKLRFTKKKG